MEGNQGHIDLHFKLVANLKCALNIGWQSNYFLLFNYPLNNYFILSPLFCDVCSCLHIYNSVSYFICKSSEITQTTIYPSRHLAKSTHITPTTHTLPVLLSQFFSHTLEFIYLPTQGQH